MKKERKEGKGVDTRDRTQKQIESMNRLSNRSRPCPKFIKEIVVTCIAEEKGVTERYMLRQALRVLEATNTRVEDPLFRGFLREFCMKESYRGVEER